MQTLPHVKKAGYNAIQLIGVVEHKDYSSVGYKVINVINYNYAVMLVRNSENISKRK